MSIKVVANNYIREDAVETFINAARVLVAKTNELDAGCISYALHRNLADPTHFVMIEEWTDQAALDAHMKAAHFLEIVPQLGACGDGREGGIGIYEVVE